MIHNQLNRKTIIKYGIILLSIIGLMVCTALLFPQVRWKIMDLAWRMVLKRELGSMFESWSSAIFSFAMGGICLILLIDYCTFTASGKTLVRAIKQEMTDSLYEIDFRSFLKPVLLMSGIYLLGLLTIIRSNFLYMDDIAQSVLGYRAWYDWSRYVIMLLSYVIQPEISLTDISPITHFLSVLILALSSVLLVYILCERKITTLRLLASIPLGLSPYILECLSYKISGQYMAFPVLVCIVPFLFVTRRKAFFFSSVIALLIMCMTYQVASGIYLMIAVVLGFQDWNNKRKSLKEILSFWATAFIAFCSALLIFKFFLMRDVSSYVSTEMHPIPRLISGTLGNIKSYALIINSDFGLIWKTGIVLVLLFFIIKSTLATAQKKIFSFFVSILVVGIMFIMSYGIYSLLAEPLFYPRGLYGFGVFLAIFCIIIVSDFKKIAAITVLALNWCLFVFAFSYGNALADQARYAEFRIGILLNDLSVLYPNPDRAETLIQINNSIDFTPSVKNIARHNPIIERLVPKRLGEDYYGTYYIIHHFYFNRFAQENIPEYTSVDFNSMNLPVVLDTFYHTIKSDGKHILIILKQ